MDSYPLDEHDLCTVCRESLANFDAAYSFGSYEGPLRKLIHLFKYAKVESLALPLSRLLMQRHADGRAFRRRDGHADALAQALGTGIQSGGTARKTCGQAMQIETFDESPAQALHQSPSCSDGSSAARQLKDSLCVRNAQQIVGKRILLIDDVFTTGCDTARRCGSLKNSGRRPCHGPNAGAGGPAKLYIRWLSGSSEQSARKAQFAGTGVH